MPSESTHSEITFFGLKKKRKTRLLTDGEKISKSCKHVKKFFITSAACDFLDGKHVVFGKVLDSDGLLVMRKIENVPTGPNNRPKLTVKVTGKHPS
jgi:hypothetical protein